MGEAESEAANSFSEMGRPERSNIKSRDSSDDPPDDASLKNGAVAASLDES